MRLFVAIDLPKSWTKSILKLQERLKKEIPAHYIKVDNLHLTLRFIGVCDVPKMKQLIHQLDNISLAFKEVPLQITTIGSFRRRGGRLLWIGIKKTPPLLALQKEVEHTIQKVGIAKDFFDYFPHITIARRASVKKDLLLENISWDLPPTFSCTSYGLYETKFLKTGVEYFIKHRFEL